MRLQKYEIFYYYCFCRLFGELKFCLHPCCEGLLWCLALIFQFMVVFQDDQFILNEGEVLNHFYLSTMLRVDQPSIYIEHALRFLSLSIIYGRGIFTKWASLFFMTIERHMYNSFRYFDSSAYGEGNRSYLLDIFKRVRCRWTDARFPHHGVPLNAATLNARALYVPVYHKICRKNFNTYYYKRRFLTWKFNSKLMELPKSLMIAVKTIAIWDTVDRSVVNHISPCLQKMFYKKLIGYVHDPCFKISQK